MVFWCQRTESLASGDRIEYGSKGEVCGSADENREVQVPHSPFISCYDRVPLKSDECM